MHMLIPVPSPPWRRSRPASLPSKYRMRLSSSHNQPRAFSPAAVATRAYTYVYGDPDIAMARPHMCTQHAHKGMCARTPAALYHPHMHSSVVPVEHAGTGRGPLAGRSRLAWRAWSAMAMVLPLFCPIARRQSKPRGRPLAIGLHCLTRPVVRL